MDHPHDQEVGRELTGGADVSTPRPGPPDAAAGSQEWSRPGWGAGVGGEKPGPSVSLKEGEGTPTPGSRCPHAAHVDDSLLGLRHVRDDPVRDDE